MSYVKDKLKRDLDPEHEALVTRLITELKSTPKTLSQAAMDPPDTPTIYEEPLRRADRLRVYVKWNRWQGVREDHRTAAIVDAYERALGGDYAGKIAIALGVTTQEATELGI